VYNAPVPDVVHPARVLAKASLLFLIFEYALASLPLHPGALNVYGLLHMERQRFPVSTLPPADAALDVGNLDAMFASHAVSRPKAPNEFRVVVLGDSAVWGLQLTPGETLPGQLDSLDLVCGTKDVRVYNLSFPRSSATKDLMILDRALSYQPDMVVWLITWYTLMPKTRVDHWLVTQNPEDFASLARQFDFLPKDYHAPSLLQKALDHNRSLFRVVRYQLYSLVQLASGRDQIAGPPEELPTELSADATFEGLKPPGLRSTQVSLDQVRDFYDLASPLPVLLVNEPMLVLHDVVHSDVRYNSYYPRWVYDQYREYVQEAATNNGWDYLDLWDSFPAQYFTDTPLHLNPDGQHLLALALAPAIRERCR
jgi:lysophospholipase L1-like esterase